MEIDAHALPADEVLAALGVDANVGLSESEVIRRRAKHGRNELAPDEGTPFWKLVLKQFDDLLVKTLLLAAVVSFVLAIVDGASGFEAFVEPGVILLILVLNAVVGVVTETNAEKAIEELKAYEADVATCLRNGRLVILPATDLVPGDVVEVSVGAKVPADLRIVKVMSHQLRADQAILTGESDSVVKSVEATTSVKAVYQDKTCILFSGTVITVGRARAVVVGTGSKTAMGEIRDTLAESMEEMTPLKKKLDEFGEFLSKVIAGICVLVWLVNIGHFRDPAHGGIIRGAIYYFKIAVALAVAAIPEGLPAVVTTCLALGTKKMARMNAIVRSLPSVETLGCTTVICSDKTGTLTTNNMSVVRVCVVGKMGGDGGGASRIDEYGVTGNTYAPEGLVTSLTGEVVERPADASCLLHMAMCGCLCNESSVYYNGTSKSYSKIGESTEVALLVYGEKVGLPGFDSMPSALQRLSKQERATYCSTYWSSQFHRIATVDFTRDRKIMSVLCTRKGQEIMFTKGAPENVLDRCSHVLCNDNGASVPLTEAAKAQMRAKFAEYGGRHALRCIGFALKPLPNGKRTLATSDETGMTFVGFVGIVDPPREEVKPALDTCRMAGIRVIVVTGDNKNTAECVCSQIGLFDDVGAGEASAVAPSPIKAAGAGKAYTGLEFDELNDSEREDAVESMQLFARVEPSHKLKLVNLLRSHNHVVAMTGDGVNDAPALKRSDIGVAMGSGTAVAKGASDMVLADDNFATIVAAVAEGRSIFNNTKAFIRYMVSSNIGEVVCIFIAAAIGMPETLVPVQLLWVNLVTDGLPATALGFNKPDRDIMATRPRKVTDGIVDSWLFVRYLVIGIYVGVVTVAGFAWWYLWYEQGPKLTWTQLTSFESCEEGKQPYSCAVFRNRSPSTISMSVLVVVEMFNALNALSENESLLTHPPWSNWWLLGAIAISMALHILILYVPALAHTFTVAPLNWDEWKCVLYLSAPVVLVDEVLKFVTRAYFKRGGSGGAYRRQFGAAVAALTKASTGAARSEEEDRSV